MSPEVKYEMLLKKIFNCERNGDPAGEVDAGYFKNSDLRAVKIMLGYATLTLESKNSDSHGMEAFCNSLHQHIEYAKSVDDLKSVVDDLAKKICG